MGIKGTWGAGWLTGVCQSAGCGGQATSPLSLCGWGAESCHQVLSFVQEAKNACCRVTSQFLDTVGN